MIHSTAIIDPSAIIAEDVTIGPYTIIGPDVEIAAGCEIASHVVIKGPSKIGKNNKILQFASVGEEPQDKKYAGEATLLEIGDNNLIRESVTINRGTVQGGGITKIGDNNWIMAYVHIAHDCIVKNNIVLANSVTLAGHVEIDDFVVLGGLTAIHQFCKIGAHVITMGGTLLSQDVPPYVRAVSRGGNAFPNGINSEGLKRRGFSVEAILDIKKGYRSIYMKENSISILMDKKNIFIAKPKYDITTPILDLINLKLK